MTALSDTSRVWDLRRRLTIEIRVVEHVELERFSRGCSELFHVVREEAGDDGYWRRIVSQFKRLRFDLALNPVPLDQNPVASLTSQLKLELNGMTRAYPLLVDRALDLLSNADQIGADPAAPLCENVYVHGVLNDARDGCMGFVVLRSRYLQPVRRYMASLSMKQPEVLLPAQLKGTEFYDNLVFVGPVEWFPEHVIVSPRAPGLVFVHFDWLNFDSPPRPAFDARTAADWGRSRLPKPIRIGASPADEPHASIDSTDFIPVIDWEALFREFDDEGHSGPYEPVEARLFALEGETCVWLRAHEGAHTYVLRLEHGEADVTQEAVKDLTPGEFLLVRTQGGGDHVVGLAMEMLGDRADQVEAAQQRWKDSLRLMIEANGMRMVIQLLRALGAVSANTANVRNWIDPDRIQPHDIRDFRAILRLLGLEEHEREYRAYGSALHRARIRAGHEIRSVLLDKAKQCDAGRLQNEGRAEFSVGSRGGSIAAWRIAAVAPTTRLISPHRIGVPEEGSAIPWLA